MKRCELIKFYMEQIEWHNEQIAWCSEQINWYTESLKHERYEWGLTAIGRDYKKDRDKYYRMRSDHKKSIERLELLLDVARI